MFAVLLTVLTVLGVSSFVELNVLKQRETQALQARATLAADRIANSLAYPLWNLSREETQRVVLDELGAADVYPIQVFDENDSLYIGKVKSADGTIKDLTTGAAPSDLGQTTVYSFSRPVQFKNTGIGRVIFEVTDKSLQTELVKHRRTIGIRLLLLVALLSVVLFAALRMLVIRPVSALQSWVETMPDPQLQAPPHFKLSGEINSLAAAFGRMSANLEKQHGQLEAEQARLQQTNQEMLAEMEDRQRAEEHFARIFDLSPFRMGLVRIKDGVLLTVNEHWLQDFGLTRAQVIGHPIVELQEQLGPEAQALVNRILRERKPVRDLEFRVKVRGQERFNITNAAIVEFGGEECFLWATNDITERKRTEDKSTDSKTLIDISERLVGRHSTDG